MDVAGRSGETGAPGLASQAQTRLLVVDDRLVSRELVKVALGTRGYDVCEACGGEEGLERALKEPFDLILLDTVMPDLDGLEVLRRIREAYSEVELPVIMLLAQAHSHDVGKALRLGANDCLAKPLDVPRLMMRIETQLKRKEEQAEVLRAAEVSGVQRADHRNTELIATNSALKQELEERKRIEQRLRESEGRYRAIYDQNPSMFYTLAADGQIVSVNDFGANQLGFTVHELLGMSLLDLQPESERAAVQGHLDASWREPSTVRRFESRMTRRDESSIWVRISAKVVEHDGSERLLLVCEDITESHNLSEQLSYQATHDALTGLVNRREFENRLGRVLETAIASEGEHALCYLDLDQFKVVNDTCGHVAGDELLRQLGDLLQNHVRKRDTLARLGGDEFAVLMEHCGIEQAQRVAQNLRATIADFRYRWEDKSFTLGVSIGVVPITRHSSDVGEVMRAADTACYVAKDGGRNRIHVFRENDEQLARRHGEMQWVVQIQRALEENRFFLEYMPIEQVVSSPRAGKLMIEGPQYEILLRMQDDRGSIIPPGAFMPSAERYNLCIDIDRWVVNAAFEWLSEYPDHLRDLGLCSINLTSRSLSDDQFLVFLDRQFRSRRIPPEKVGFELSETAAITNLASATRFIKVLKEWGCRMALDDFGSGLSSFAYLKSLPVDCLKVDGVFVKDIADDPLDFAMVRSFYQIGGVTGKEMVAEFVESPEILAKVREIGIDYAQGYGIGRPRPLRELA